MIGGQTGNGALMVNGTTTGYYNISAASFSFQAGGQAFSNALFFLNDAALQYLETSDGWPPIGFGPSVVIADRGVAHSLTSTALTQEVYASPFGPRGLMKGAGLEASKITRIRPERE
jgi:lipid-binding SYLF domain-containing protein